MKVVVNFDLNDERDEYKYKIFLHGSKYFKACDAALMILRNELKHGDLSSETLQILETIRTVMVDEIHDQEEVL